MVRTTVLLQLGAALIGSVGPGALQAQAHEYAAAIARGDQLHSISKPDEALLIFEEVLFEVPRDYDVLWRAARESAVLGLGAPDDRTRKGRLKQSETYARLAVTARKSGLEGHYWLSVALSGQSPLTSPQHRVALLEEVRSEAERVLTLQPDHPGAHLLLGQWHAEVKRLSSLASLVAKTIRPGSPLNDASWEEAERLLSRSIELDSQALTPRLELARVYLDTGRAELARHTLQDLLSQPVRGPLDPAAKDRARELLMELEGEAGPDPWGPVAAYGVRSA